MTYGQIGAIVCGLIFVIFSIVALIFAVFGEKAAPLIAGFNGFSGFNKERRARYDQKRLCRDMRNRISIWAVIFLVGGVLSYLIDWRLTIIAFVVFMIAFLKEVKPDTETAFDKYRLS